MMPTIPICEALADANLLGAALGDIGSWRTWVAILKAAFAEPLTDEERALFALVAGDRAPPSRRVSELWCGPIGRRSGKVAHGRCRCVSRRAADRSQQAAGTGRNRHCGGDRSQRAIRPNTVFNYVRGFLMASPLLAGQVESINRDEIMLRGDIVHQRDDQQFPDGARHDVAGGALATKFRTGETKARRSLMSRPIARCCRAGGSRRSVGWDLHGLSPCRAAVREAPRSFRSRR